MKFSTIHVRARYLLACLAGAMLVLSACSSDDVQEVINQIIDDETVTVSGVVTRGSTPESGVTVTGNYRNSTIPAATTTTDANGAFTLTVLKDTPVSVQISKSGSDIATLNAAYESSSVDITGINIDVVTTAEADAVIALAYPTFTLGGGQAWLAVMVMDASDNDIGGAAITTNANPSNLGDQTATRCDGTYDGGVVTISGCNPPRDGPMYLAWFSAETEVTVSVTGSTDSQIAPVRVGEVTILEFVQ